MSVYDLPSWLFFPLCWLMLALAAAFMAWKAPSLPYKPL